MAALTFSGRTGEPWVSSGSLIDGELVAQREDFDLQRQTGAEKGRNAFANGNHDGSHGDRSYRGRWSDSMPSQSAGRAGD